MKYLFLSLLLLTGFVSVKAQDSTRFVILPHYSFVTTDNIEWIFSNSTITKQRYDKRGHLLMRHIYKTEGHPFVFMDSLDVVVVCYEMESVAEIYITFSKILENATGIVQGKLDDPKSIHQVKID